jgi:hypothetical protein
MAGQECHFVTLVQGRGLDPNLRQNVWHLVWTRCKQDWPAAEAWTVAEYSQKRGLHLHVVIKVAPGLTQTWLDRVVSQAQPGAHALVEPVENQRRLAVYLLKQLREPSITASWPRGFHPVSASRRWLPRPDEDAPDGRNE